MADSEQSTKPISLSVFWRASRRDRHPSSLPPISSSSWLTFFLVAFFLAGFTSGSETVRSVVAADRIPTLLEIVQFCTFRTTPRSVPASC